MDDIKKRILLDLVVSPWTIIPIVGGLSLLFLSRIIPLLAFPGFVGIVLGIGALVTNMVFNLDGIAKNAMKEIQVQAKSERKRQLDALDRRLSSDNDPRDQTYLRDLRSMYEDFCDDIAAGRISRGVNSDMLAQVDQIFEACVRSLEHQFNIYEMAHKMQGDLRNDLLQQQEEVIQEVGKHVRMLAKVINQVRALKFKAHKSELIQLQNNLARSLAVSQQIEDFTSRAGAGADDVISRYEEYLG